VEQIRERSQFNERSSMKTAEVTKRETDLISMYNEAKEAIGI
jgi:hypothetical protein